MKTLLLTTLSLLISATLHAGILNTNLILNADAESGTGSVSGNDVVPVPNWTTTNNFTVGQWGDASSVPTNAPGPANRGTNYFVGGPSTAASGASQTIDVTAAADQIDSGIIRAELTGFVGGWSVQDDNATVSATFLDHNTNTLGQISIGPVFAAERSNNTALIFHAATNTVPAGTRSIQVQMVMTRLEGSYDDGLADNLSLVLRFGVQLGIVSTGNNVIVSWPTNATGFQLQTTTNLASPTWEVSPATIGTNGIFFMATNHPDTRARFFRLSQ